MSRLKEQYQNEIVDAMIKKFGYKNIMDLIFIVAFNVFAIVKATRTPV